LSSPQSFKYFSHRDDDYEVLQFKDFLGPFTSNSKTFKAVFRFQGLFMSWKNGYVFKGLSRPCGHPVVQLTRETVCLLTVPCTQLSINKTQIHAESSTKPTRFHLPLTTPFIYT